MQVNVLEAKNRLSELLKAARSGEDVVIANRGEPVARLVAVHGPAGHHASPRYAGDLLAWLEKNPLPAHLRRSHEQIEASIQAERDSWD